MINDGGQAFPGVTLKPGEFTGKTYEVPTTGMTLRQYYAGIAMGSLITMLTDTYQSKSIPIDAFYFADKMIAYEQKEKGQEKDG